MACPICVCRPSAEKLAPFGALELDATLSCTSGVDDQCDHWDHIITLDVTCTEPGGAPATGGGGGLSEDGGAKNELGRWVTPYRRRIGRWLTPISQFAPMLPAGTATTNIVFDHFSHIATGLARLCATQHTTCDVLYSVPMQLFDADWCLHSDAMPCPVGRCASGGCVIQGPTAPSRLTCQAGLQLFDADWCLHSDAMPGWAMRVGGLRDSGANCTFTLDMPSWIAVPWVSSISLRFTRGAARAGAAGTAKGSGDHSNMTAAAGSATGAEVTLPHTQRERTRERHTQRERERDSHTHTYEHTHEHTHEHQTHARAHTPTQTQAQLPETQTHSLPAAKGCSDHVWHPGPALLFVARVTPTCIDRARTARSHRPRAAARRGRWLC